MEEIFGALKPITRIRNLCRSALALPGMFTAGAGNGISRPLLGELLSANWARFSHHVCHKVAPSCGLIRYLSNARRGPEE
jgi:hypothetical protein